MSNKEIYYKILDTLRGKENMFWKCEIYTREDFEKEDLVLEELLKQDKCKLLEEKENEQELSHISNKELHSRLELPSEQWIHLPQGVSVFDYHYMSEEEKEKTRKLGYKHYQENVKKFQEERKKEKDDV